MHLWKYLWSWTFTNKSTKTPKVIVGLITFVQILAEYSTISLKMVVTNVFINVPYQSVQMVFTVSTLRPILKTLYFVPSKILADSKISVKSYVSADTQIQDLSLTLRCLGKISLLHTG